MSTLSFLVRGKRDAQVSVLLHDDALDSPGAVPVAPCCDCSEFMPFEAPGAVLLCPPALLWYIIFTLTLLSLSLFTVREVWECWSIPLGSLQESTAHHKVCGDVEMRVVSVAKSLNYNKLCHKKKNHNL